MVPPFLLGEIYSRGCSVSLLRNCAREIRAMRGAQDADGHAPERARRRPLARPNRARALADDVAKRAPERAEAFPAGVKGDLGDRKIGVAEQCGRSLDAPSEQVAMRRDTE